MRTRKFKSQRSWLNYVAKRGTHGETCLYETLEDFFAKENRYHYFVHYGEPGERFVNERVEAPQEWKLPIARRIVDFHWSRKTKAEREHIAGCLARGEGDLSMLKTFQLEMRRNGAEWEYDYCTCGLSGPNYDYCKRKYLQSI